jgi:hypothetical protein
VGDKGLFSENRVGGCLLVKAGMLQITGWGLTHVQRQLEMPGASVAVVRWQCNKRVSIV